MIGSSSERMPGSPTTSSPNPTPPPEAAGRGERPTAGVGLGAVVGRFAVVGAYVVMVAIFIALEPHTFLTWATVKNVLDQSAVPVMLVSGLTLVLVIGEFDLSFTAVVGLTAGLVVKLMSSSGMAVLPSVLIALAAAAALGVALGGFVAFSRASSFIVTLALGSIVTGVELALTGNKTIYEGIPLSYGDLATKSVLGLHRPVWLALIVLLLGVVLLHGTRFGRHAKAIGENRVAARLAGLRVERITILCYLLVAVLAGLAAIVLTSRSSSYYPNSSAGFLLNTYAAAFLGAAVGSHNRFTVAGSALGVLWLTTLQTGLTLHNEPAWTSSLIQGCVLAAAVLIAARGRGSEA